MRFSVTCGWLAVCAAACVGAEPAEPLESEETVVTASQPATIGPIELCGYPSMACCAGDACRAGLVCNGALGQRTCVPCGAFGGRCCANNACGSGLQCVSGTCRCATGYTWSAATQRCATDGNDDGDACLAGGVCNNGLRCFNGICRVCIATQSSGPSDRPCCDPVNARSVVATDAPVRVCWACGIRGFPCCAGSVCGAGLSCVRAAGVCPAPTVANASTCDACQPM